MHRGINYITVPSAKSLIQNNTRGNKMSETINKELNAFWSKHGTIEIDDSAYELCRKIVVIDYPNKVTIKHSMQLLLNFVRSLGNTINIHHIAANEYSVSFFLTYMDETVDSPMVA